MKLYLIQRGNWNEAKNEVDFEPEYLFGRQGLFTCDYMGSAEFEWGALPASMNRIYEKKDQYVLTDTGLKNRNGVPFLLYCHKEELSETIQAIGVYINNPYYTKEFTELDKAFDKEPTRINGKVFLPLRTHFWWDIENDWMGFFGVEHEEKLFSKAVENHWKLFESQK